MNNKIRNFLIGAFLFVLFVVSWNMWHKKAVEEDVLKIGFITDAHFNAEKKKKTKKLHWRSREAMERFIEKMNNDFHPDLVIENGDFIDGKDKRSEETWKEANEMFKKAKAPTYHVLGNHETNSFEKEKWLKLTGYEKTYYFLDIDKKNIGYRIIVLDGNSLPDDSDAGPEKHYYPGHIDKKQWQWLEDRLEEARREKREVVVFIHQPPLSTDFFLNWGIFPQGLRLHQLFKKYEVRAVFSGHIENLCNVKDGVTKYFVLQGFWKGKRYLKKEYRFKDAGAFYEISISPNDVKVIMEYRVFNDKVKKGNHLDKLKGWFRQPVTEKYNCQDGKQLDPEYQTERKEKEKRMPVSFLRSEAVEYSGLTFFGDDACLVNDNGEVKCLNGDRIRKKASGLIPDAEGITHDGKYLYVLSELENTIYKLNKDLEIIEKRKLLVPREEDVNIGLEGIAFYKDNLFFVVHQSAKVADNIFLVDFSTGEIVKKGKIEEVDLAGATMWNNVLYVVSGEGRQILRIDPEKLVVISGEDTDDKTIEGIDVKAGEIFLIKDNEKQNIK